MIQSQVGASASRVRRFAFEVLTGIALMGTTVSCAGDIHGGIGQAEEALVEAGRWSNPDTWGGQVPRAGQDVVIPQGTTIILDRDTPALGQLRIEGKLEFDRKNVSLTAKGITLSGTLAIGSEQEPFTQRATITLTGEPSDAPESRGLMVHQGSLLVYARSPSPTWTVLNDHARAGASSLKLAAAPTHWKGGDQVVVAPTDFYGTASTERVSLEGASEHFVNLQAPLREQHFGRLQYATARGMELTPDRSFQPAVPGAPTVLDERAEVANLSRNVVIQGADDAAWRDQGFGAHVMIMGASSNTVLDGVELRRVGQAGKMARYPVHFHMLSYNQNGDEVASQGLRIVRKSSIWDSKNRCITIHGTNSTILSENICYDVRGHAIFFEDAVERKNVLYRNLVLKVRMPEARHRLINSDQAGDGTGSAGVWLTNPDNFLLDNHVADSEGNGFWLAFPRRPLGKSKAVRVRPNHLPLGMFSQNTTHSNQQTNIQLDWVPNDDQGTVVPNHYEPTTDGEPPNGENRVRFTIDRVTSYKGASLWNRPVGATLTNWVTADNVGIYFSGGGYDGRIEGGLHVGESLNNHTTWRDRDPNAPPTAFASYHSEYTMRDNTLVNFPIYPGPELRANGGRQVSHGGMLETKDYYITPVDLGFSRIQNNLLVNTHPGYRVAKPDKPGAHWTLAGALWDPEGLWGPAGNYWVYDMPFLTADTSCVTVQPAGQNGKSCAGPYYGLEDFSGNDDSLRPGGRFVRTLSVRREDSSGGAIDTWNVGDGRTGDGFFDLMRHAPLARGGRFVIEMSDDRGSHQERYVPSADFAFHLANLKRPDDEVLVGVPFSGSQPARAYVSSHHVADAMPPDAEQLRALRAVGSIAEVQAGAGDVYYHDRGTQRVWIKVRSPKRRDPAGDPSELDLRSLHRGTWVRVFSCEEATRRPRSGSDAALSLCR